ncbi:MAG: thymidine phosphorylase [Eubacteriaceae bacterium]|nr:thymidine phosphorylase [Eubacteriaceae bacterium]
MDMCGIIRKKRDGGKLSKEEISYFIKGFTEGSIPDYQASALLMAVYLQKMDREETYDLTDAMKNSGDVADLSSIKGIKVDKHSTGGVGDKTTLITVPLAAACGVPVAKMSGRGLGFTGGTVDKMESVPGLKTAIPEKEFFDLVNNNGLAVIGQTAQIAKADKLLYALRDVTATVDNISLITSSVMCKKLASGSDAIVLDVKCGAGAFMNDLPSAERMASLMVEMGNKAGKKTIAVITNMDQPLGNAVGNSLEVIEAIETLKGNGPSDITELSVTLAGVMIYAGKMASSIEEGKAMAKTALYDGSGLEKLRTLFTGQGGCGDVIEDHELFPSASEQVEIIAETKGYVSAVTADIIGLASQHTGAGRIKKEDIPDLAAGIMLHCKTGDRVKKGDTLAVLYGNDQEKLRSAAEECRDAFEISNEEPVTEKLIKKIIE